MASIKRILIHDYAGHPYAVQLSRALAREGLDVLHVYSSSNPMPQGSLKKTDDDPTSFNVRPISVGSKIEKANFVKRRAQEIAHGHLAVGVIRDYKPDAILSGSTPLDAQRLLWEECQRAGIPAVFWLQDITGIAMEAVLGQKLPLIGRSIGRHYRKLEEKLLRQSAAVVAISADFNPILKNAGVQDGLIHIVENWGPIDEIVVGYKSNDWSKKHGLDSTFNFIYTGTLGMKHDPQILLDLSNAFQENSNVRLVVITEGIGRKWLEEQKRNRSIQNLILMDFQSFADVPNVMASADVLTAILEPSAGIFSVPSKVLSYLCASRPILLSVPPENLAARIVTTAHAGLVSPPGDSTQFIQNATKLFCEAQLREEMGRNGRKYAEDTFNIDRVAKAFIEIFSKI